MCFSEPNGCHVFVNINDANRMPKEAGIRNQVISKRYGTILVLYVLLARVWIANIQFIFDKVRQNIYKIWPGFIFALGQKMCKTIKIGDNL